MPDIPPPKNETSQPVFVIATQRSGTNYLRSLLRGTGAFADFDETLHSEIDEKNPAPFAYWDWSKHSYFKFRADRITANPNLSIPLGRHVVSLFNDYMDYLSSEAGKSPYFLIDIKYNSLHHFDPIWHFLTGRKFIFDLINARGCRVLHLVRENVFNVYLSSQVAEATGKYVVAQGDAITVPRVSITIDHMFATIERIEREINLIRLDLESVSNVYELTYESICSDPNGVPESIVSELSDFFSIRLQFRGQPTTQKIIKNRWSVIDNVEEVKQALEASPYSWCIE